MSVNNKKKYKRIVKRHNPRLYPKVNVTFTDESVFDTTEYCLTMDYYVRMFADILGSICNKNDGDPIVMDCEPTRDSYDRSWTSTPTEKSGVYGLDSI